MPREIDLVLRPDAAADADALHAAAARAARVPVDEVADVRVLRRALDARRGVHMRLRVRVLVRGEHAPAAAAPRPPSFPAPRRGRPVVIVGDGPAGIFAALRLAEHSVPAVVVERGKPVQARRRDLAALNKQGVVDPESNYCFGEGGAGTYSDGKLYTRSTKRGDVMAALRTVNAPEILNEQDAYAASALSLAEVEVDNVIARGEPARMLELVVLGTVLGEALFAALRLLAHEHASMVRLGARIIG